MPTHTVRVIARQDLDRWVARLIEYAEVIAPIRAVKGDTLFATVTSPADVLWQFENPLLPPKWVLLPQTETVARIHRRNGHHEVEPPPPPRRRVLLNARSCDTTALALLRHVSEEDPPDESVLRRADALTVVTLGCNRPCALGFCVCCDAGPFLREDFDLQITDLGAALHVEIASEKGQALIDLAPALFKEASDAALEARARAEDMARASLGHETCHFGGAMRRISTNRVPDELWAAMEPWCLECGGCTYACPTCYCFSVGDRVDAAVGEDGDDACWVRCRTWDSCQYAAFTMEASGHNPRAQHAERIKRRFFHKASAQYLQREGRLGCVGCGRCIKVCMGSTDMPAVVRAVRKGTWDMGRAL